MSEACKRLPLHIELLLYVVIAYGLAGLLDLALSSQVLGANNVFKLLWGFLRMYTPAIASLTLLFLEGCSLRSMLNMLALTVKNNRSEIIRWYLLAPLVPLAPLAIYIVMAYAIGIFSLEALQNLLREPSISMEMSLWHFLALTLVLGYIASISVNAFFALGEEIGWRGLLPSLLEKKLGYLGQIVVIGMLWGLWHASAILILGYNYPIHRFEGVFLFTVFTVVLTPTLLEVRRRVKSILPAASLHGAINAYWGLTLLVTKPDYSEVLGGLGILGILAWLVASMLLLLFLRRG